MKEGLGKTGGRKMVNDEQRWRVKRAYGIRGMEREMNVQRRDVERDGEGYMKRWRRGGDGQREGRGGAEMERGNGGGRTNMGRGKDGEGAEMERRKGGGWMDMERWKGGDGVDMDR